MSVEGTKRHAIILHGRPSEKQFYDPDFPSPSNYYWLPWLQKQLALAGIPTQTPEVPNAWIPEYATWKEAFEQCTVDEQTVLVGHSCGAGFLLRWLSENQDVRVAKVVLIAPWYDPTGDPDNEQTQEFFDFTLDREMVGRAQNFTIIYSTNDAGTIQKSVQSLRDELAGAAYVELANRGHFYDDDSMTVPELLEEIKR